MRPARVLCCFAITIFLVAGASSVSATDPLARDASWTVPDVDQMEMRVRASLDQMGVKPGEIDAVAKDFTDAVRRDDADALEAFIAALDDMLPIVDRLVGLLRTDPVAAASELDPGTSTYASLEAMPRPMRMSIRTWLGRELVRERLYDEALPVIAEVDPTESIDPSAALFYRAVCYQALLMKKEALRDLRVLLENEDQMPRRYSRTAKLMIADIKPMKKDSLDEISRLMTDVTRRLDLGRSGERVKEREQEIIDKLTKLIEKAEEEQKRQQQQQQQ
ncbi:MAG: hypothetical protein AAF958_05080, partial [Planctomycetota bacterium]